MDERRISATHIVVAGLGRCGSSLVMQMLDAAGVPCLGRFPGFEDEHVQAPIIDRAWLAVHAGAAVKILDPHLHRWPSDLPRFVILLSRTPVEQARSQLKFVSQHRLVDRSRRAVRAMTARIMRDQVLAARSVAGTPTLRLRFEDLVGQPEVSASALRIALAAVVGRTLDAERMAGCVVRRDPRCADDMGMEMRLLAQLDLRRGYL